MWDGGLGVSECVQSASGEGLRPGGRQGMVYLMFLRRNRPGQNGCETPLPASDRTGSG